MDHSLDRPNACIECGYIQDSSTCPNDAPRKPEPGDFSLCLNCGAIAVFNSDLSQRPASASEIEEAMTNQMLSTCLFFIKERGLIHERVKPS